MRQPLTKLLSLASLATGLFLSLGTQASPLPAGLQINAQIALDTANSQPHTGGGQQSISIERIVGGSSTTSSTSGDPGTLLPSQLQGQLSELQDGLGAEVSIRGRSSQDTGTPVAASSGLIAIDYFFSLQNLSATDTFTVSFRALTVHSISASGPDAFVQSNLSVLDAANNELYFTDYRADTANPGPGSNFQLSSASDTFAFTVLPGQSLSFSALLKQIGGAADGSYSALLSAYLLVDNVRVDGNNPVPAPGTLPLLVLALLGCATVLRRRA